MGNNIGVTPPKRKIPDWLVLLIGYLSSVKAKITGMQPIISLQVAKIAIDDHYFTPKKAIEELELPQTPLEVAILEAFEWFKENRYL